MIAKHIPMRTVAKSDYRELVRYITDPQTKQERVGAIAVTNCIQQDALDAAFEVQAVQSLNTRAEGDKTYHLVISFREGENPSADVLQEIERRIADALGYGEHQRISAVHHDTDNLHVHVAINKIHPQRRTIHTPYNDHKTLGRVSAALEREFGLEPDNHVPKKNAAQNRAGDMEAHAGVQSLLGWIKAECVDQLRNADSWSALHAALEANGLRMVERGNGLVVHDANGVGVKASSIAREFSRSQLVNRLGEFEPAAAARSMERRNPKRSQLAAAQKPVPGVGAKPPRHRRGRHDSLSALQTLSIDNGKRYEQRPVATRSSFDTTALYAQYQREQQHAAAARAESLGLARAERDRRIEKAKATANLKRAAIKLIKGAGVNKPLLYGVATRALRREIDAAHQAYREARNVSDERHRRRAWADWLQVKSVEGNSEALNALRARNARVLRGHNVLTGAAASSRVGGMSRQSLDGITKAGTAIYRFGPAAIRDDGKAFAVSRGADDGGVEVALQMAIKRYGKSISVNGSEQFRQAVVRVAAARNYQVSFDDAALEAQRRQLIESANSKGEKHDNERFGAGRAGGARDAREPDRRRDGVARVATATGTRYRPVASNRFDRAGQYPWGWRAPARNGAGAKRDAARPNVGRVGRVPPPAAIHRLRNLSALGVVHVPQGGEVLLPRDVSRNVEHQGAKPDDRVRRPVAGSGRRVGEGGADFLFKAADAYIAEREGKRLKGFDIPKHRRYNDRDAGACTFRGVRQIDESYLALLGKEGEMLVVPIDAATANRLRRVGQGGSVNLTADGAVRVKGRTR